MPDTTMPALHERLAAFLVDEDDADVLEAIAQLVNDRALALDDRANQILENEDADSGDPTENDSGVLEGLSADLSDVADELEALSVRVARVEA
jgi:hypothetical protein